MANILISPTQPRLTAIGKIPQIYKVLRINANVTGKKVYQTVLLAQGGRKYVWSADLDQPDSASCWRSFLAAWTDSQKHGLPTVIGTSYRTSRGFEMFRWTSAYVAPAQPKTPNILDLFGGE